MATWECDNCGAMTTGEHQPDACPECGQESFSKHTISRSRSERLAQVLGQPGARLEDVVRSAVPGLSGSVDTRRARVVLVAVVVVAALPMLAVADLDGDRLSTHEELQQSASTAGQLNPVQKQPPAFVAVYRNLTAAGQDQLVAAYYDDGTLTTEERAQLRFLAALSQDRLRTIAADQTLHTYDLDGDGGLNWGERNIGSDPFAENPRIAAVAAHVPDGELADNHTARILEAAYENPHNIHPQVEQYAANNLEGEVTQEDVRALADGDEDGLVRFLETELGTDSTNPDTDGDNLLDGWEYAGGVVIEGRYQPLPDSDPLHKDLYLHIFPVAADFPESAEDPLVKRFAESPVKNPDGETGIDLHLEIANESEMQRYGLTNEDWDKLPFAGKSHDHNLSETRYYMAVVDIDEENAIYGQVVAQYAFVVGAEAIEDNVSVSVVDHESSHILMGTPDPEKTTDDRPGHLAEGHGAMSVTNPAVTEEITRDGMLGKKRVMKEIREGEKEWRLPGNETAG